MAENVLSLSLSELRSATHIPKAHFSSSDDCGHEQTSVRVDPPSAPNLKAAPDGGSGPLTQHGLTPNHHHPNAI